MNRIDDDSQAASPLTVPILMFWIALLGGVAYHFYARLDYVGLSFIAVIAITSFGGYRIGAARIVALFFGLSAAIWFAPTLGASQEHLVPAWVGASPLSISVFSVAAAGILISLLVSVFVGLVTTQLMKNRPRLTQANKWFGFFIGGIEGAVAVFLLLGGMLIVEPLVKNRGGAFVADAGAPIVSDLVLTVAQQTRDSKLGPFIKENNPFTRFPELNQVEKIRKAVDDMR